MIWAISREMKKIEQSINDTDKTIKRIFQNQDLIMKELEKFEKLSQILATQKDDLLLEKEALIEMAALETGSSEINVNLQIVAGTRVSGPRSSMVLTHNQSACRLIETTFSDPEKQESHKIIIQML